MVQIGRKIYYELSTGNVIFDTGDRHGDVVETTQDQDFTMFSALQPYDPAAVGVLQLAFGQDSDNFSNYPYHIDTTTNTVVWDTANPIGATLDDIKNAKISQLNVMYNQTLKSGFTINIGGMDYNCGCTADDLAKLNAAETAIQKTYETFPIEYADVYGNAITLSSQSDLDLLEQTATKFGFAQHKQILDLISQVRSQTTNDNGEVDAIQWTPAAY